MSWTGLCLRCGLERVAENITGLALHQGEPLERWRRGVAASVGGALLDDPARAQ
jgi:hypothetical protein